MPKLLSYGVLAVLDFVAAYYFITNGRVVLPAILVIAGVCFMMAAIGAARKSAV